MNKTMITAALAGVVAVGALVALVAATNSQAVSKPAPAAALSSEQQVRAANAAFYTALNAFFTGEMSGIENIWSHAADVTYMGPAGGMQVGWTAVHANWKMQAVMKLGGTVEPKDMHVTVGTDIAVTQQVEQGTNTNMEGKPMTVSIRATNTFRLEGGAWKMIGHHTDLIPVMAK